MLEYLKQEEELNLNQSIYLSTLPLSYRRPDIIEYKLNYELKNDINHIKIIIPSIIFSVFITLILSGLFLGFQKKNRKKRRSEQ